MNKTVSILGATGSVGTQALDVARMRGYRVDFISAGKNVAAAEAFVREFSPSFVAMADEGAAADLKVRIADTKTLTYAGEAGIINGIRNASSDCVVNAITGMAGLMPTLAAINSGKRLCLANKESLVIAGDIVMSSARELGAEIIPVDSEHSAIFQSMKAGKRNEVKRILLTASGGPFFGKSRAELAKVTPEDTLRHPTWKMGKKITVDSATLMNKGFEVIEAAHLFGVAAKKIKVVIHRESILHSAVEYVDNTVIGELSVPDMRSCIQYAVDYPDRLEATIDELDLFKMARLTFSEPDTEGFPLLSLAGRAMSDGGAMGAVLNAADEVAVAAFLEGKLSFLGIADTVAAVYEKMQHAKSQNNLEGILLADKEAREIAKTII